MPYLTDMPKTCRDRATNPLELLKAIKGEFDRGLNGEIFDPTYVLEKLWPLVRHVEWMAWEASVEEIKRNAQDQTTTSTKDNSND